MSKGLFITITCILLGLFGGVTYYGMQALEPHTYIPKDDVVGDVVPASSLAPEEPVTLPALPGLPPKSIPSTDDGSKLSNSLDTKNLKPIKVLATDAQLAYLATSTIREINPDKLFFAPDDARAFPYGKDGVFVMERPSNLVRTSLWTINTTAKTVTRIAGPAFGLMARWSKNGRYVFVMNTDGVGALTLSFIDTKLKTATPLRMATLPSKCFIADSGHLMYCGVPQGAPEGTMLPEDYLDGTFLSSDRIMKIDFKSPKVTELWDGMSESIDIENPVVIETNLLFKNRVDDSIWKLAL